MLLFLRVPVQHTKRIFCSTFVSDTVMWIGIEKSRKKKSKLLGRDDMVTKQRIANPSFAGCQMQIKMQTFGVKQRWTFDPALEGRKEDLPFVLLFVCFVKKTCLHTCLHSTVKEPVAGSYQR